MLLKILSENYSVVMFFILRAINKRNRTIIHVPGELLDSLRIMTKLQKIALSEFNPF
jgi:hypothetical protein